MQPGSYLTETRPRLAWDLHGEQGPPVLLVMGFAMRGLVWRPQLDLLPLHHRVITYDHRGIGRSESAGRLWTMQLLAADARRVLDAAGWESAHVVGVSMGGMVAQELALRHPERVRSLTLVVTHGGGAAAWRPSREGLSALSATLAGPVAGRVEALERLLYPAEYLASVDRVAFRASLGDRTGYKPPRRTLVGQLGAIVRHHTVPRLPRIAVPTLVVRAGRDILVDPAHSHTLAERIPGAELLDFPDAGHGVIHQCRDPLNERLLAHFASVRGPGGTR